MIEDGYAATDEIMPDMAQDFAAGKLLLWIVWGDEKRILSALTTQLLRLRSGLVCKMTACGGREVSRWKHLHLEIEKYAKREGCVGVRIEGREGWLRHLTGYRSIGIIMDKRV